MVITYIERLGAIAIVCNDDNDNGQKLYDIYKREQLDYIRNSFTSF